MLIQTKNIEKKTKPLDVFSGQTETGLINLTKIMTKHQKFLFFNHIPPCYINKDNSC